MLSLSWASVHPAMEQGSSAYKPLVWVIGDSFVHWTSRVVATTGAGMDLILIATVHWMGKRGLHITKFNDFLHRCWESEQTSPDYIILHVGSNDLGFLLKKAILEAIKSVLTVTRTLLPQTTKFRLLFYPEWIIRALFNRTRWNGPAGPLTVGSVTSCALHQQG